MCGSHKSPTEPHHSAQASLSPPKWFIEGVGLGQKSKDLENVGKEARCEVVTASENRRASGCVGFRSSEVGRTSKMVPSYSGAEDVAPHTSRPIDDGVHIRDSQAGTTRVNVASTSGHSGCCSAAVKEKFARTCDVHEHSRSVKHESSDARTPRVTPQAG